MTSDIMKRQLADSFALIADRTRCEADESTVTWYIEVWSAERLQPAAIIQAIRIVLADWDNGRWPSPGLIATRARQIMRDDEAYMAGERQSRSQLESVYAIADAERWDERRHRAREFLKRHKGIWDAIEKVVEVELKRTVKDLGLRDDLVRRMKAGFAEGAAIGICLDLERIEHTEAGRKRIAALLGQESRDSSPKVEAA